MRHNATAQVENISVVPLKCAQKCLMTLGNSYGFPSRVYHIEMQQSSNREHNPRGVYCIFCGSAEIGHNAIVTKALGIVSKLRCRLASIWIPIIKIRLSSDRLIFIMGIHIWTTWRVDIEAPPLDWLLCTGPLVCRSADIVFRNFRAAGLYQTCQKWHTFYFCRIKELFVTNCHRFHLHA